MTKFKRALTSFVVPLLSILLAFIIGAVIMAVLGKNPFKALQYLGVGAFGSAANFGTTLTKATPLIFTALCACFAYRCGVFNLGGEGQFLAGSMAAITVSLLIGHEGWWVTVVAVLAGTIAGGI